MLRKVTLCDRQGPPVGEHDSCKSRMIWIRPNKPPRITAAMQGKIGCRKIGCRKNWPGRRDQLRLPVWRNAPIIAGYYGPSVPSWIRARCWPVARSRSRRIAPAGNPAARPAAQLCLYLRRPADAWAYGTRQPGPSQPDCDPGWFWRRCWPC